MNQDKIDMENPQLHMCQVSNLAVYNNMSQIYRITFAKIRDVVLNWDVWQLRRKLLQSSGHKDTRLYGVTPHKTVILPLTTSATRIYRMEIFRTLFRKFSLFPLVFHFSLLVLSRKLKKKRYVDTTSVRLSATKTICRIFMKLGTVLHKVLSSKREFRENRLSGIHTVLKSVNKFVLNPLTPNGTYRGRTAPLNSKRCILYIYSNKYRYWIF